MACCSVTLLLLIGLQIMGPSVAVDINRLQQDSGSAQTGDTCKDCTQIFELMADLLSNKEFLKMLVSDAEGLCEHLPVPKSTVKVCKDKVDTMLPVAIHFITGIIKPAEMCKVLGLCRSCEKQQKMLDYFVKEALEAAEASETASAPPQRNVCSFCIFLMRTLEGLLPKKRTEDAVIRLLEDICHILPASYQQQCEDVVGKFSKIIIDAILSYATPHSICELLHLCKSQDATPLDPCTLEAYRCRDFSTALKCGTLSYCQKFTWKPENTN